LVKIDKDRCVGCGICVNICPQGFEILNRKAKIKNENANCIIETANSCPRGQLFLKKTKIRKKQVQDNHLGLDLLMV
jgi:ferredoxin